MYKIRIIFISISSEALNNSNKVTDQLRNHRLLGENIIIYVEVDQNLYNFKVILLIIR